MARTLGVGLVGYGGIGRLHALCYRMLPLVYPDLPYTVRLVAVASGSLASVERARRELGDVLAITSLEELLAHPEVDLVDCCAPTGAHTSVALAALSAGKLLFCEKPLAATSAEAAQIVALADAHGLVGGVNFHFRGVPAIQEAQRRVAQGLLGSVYGFHARYYRASNIKQDRPLTWRFSGPGSGVLQDLGAHLIDLVAYLLGPIVRVSAHTRTVVAARPGPDGRLAPVEGDDIAWLALELAGGGRGTIEASKVVPGAADDLRLEAYGARASMVVDLRDPNQLYWADAAGDTGGQLLTTLNRATPTPALPGPETPSGVVQWHLAALAGFLTAVAAGTRPQPDLAEAAQVQRVIEAALQSAKQGGTPVALV